MLRKIGLGLLVAFSLSAEHGPEHATQVPTPIAEVQSLLSKVQELVKAGRQEEALTVCSDAHTKAQELKDVAGQARALMEAGTIQMNLNQRSEARATWERALAVLESMGASANGWKADVLFSLGVVSRELGAPNPSISYYERSIPLNEARGNRKAVGQALNDLHLVYSSIGQWKHAEALVRQAINIFREIDDQYHLAMALCRLGDYLTPLDIAKSEQVLQAALVSARVSKNVWFEARALAYLGTTFRLRGKLREALDLSMQAHKLIEGTAGETEQNILTRVASVLSDMGRFEEAKTHLLHSLEINRAIGRTWNVAARLVQLGNLLNALNDPLAASAEYDEALRLAPVVGDRNIETDAIVGLGRSYSMMGQHNRALECFDRASRAYVETERPSWVPRIQLEVARTRMALGQASKAYQLLENSLAFFTSSAEVRIEWSCNIGLGDLWLDMGLPSEAISHYRRALEPAKGLELKSYEGWAELAIGRALMRLGRYREAGAPLERSRKIYQAMGLMTEAQSLTLLGELARRKGALDEAEHDLLLAREVLGQKGSKNRQAQVTIELARLAWTRSRLHEARTNYLAAARLYQDWGDHLGAATALSELSSVSRATGRLKEAEGFAIEAKTIIEAGRAGLGIEGDSLENALVAFVTPYHQLVGLAVDRNDAVAAFEAVQRAKARVLVAIQGQPRDVPRSLMTKEERAEEERLRQSAMAIAAKAIVSPAGRDGERGSAQDLLREEARSAEQRLLWLYDRVRERLAGSAGRIRSETATLREIGEQLPADTAILEFAHLSVPDVAGKPMPSRTCLLVTSSWRGQAQLRLHPVAMGEADLTRAISDLREACAERWGPWRTRAAALYKTLLGPAAKEIAGKKRLIVCPDGPLWDLPFQVLVDEKGKTLTERFEVDYAYCASAARSALTAKREPKGSKLRVGPLVVAAPDFGIKAPASSTQRRAAEIVVPRGSKLVPLPGTKREAEAIRRIFPGTSAFMGAAAQEASVKKHAGAYRFLHFATHGFVNDAAPMLSSLALARPAKGSGEDGYLTAMEISNMNLPADLVVLSACNTAGGEVRRGEGMVGLSWALHVAGARSQVLTKWAVDDASTATLMSGFYGRLKKGQTKGQALREASLALMHDGRHGHPYFWAPFVLMGDWRN